MTSVWLVAKGTDLTCSISGPTVRVTKQESFLGQASGGRLLNGSPFFASCAPELTNPLFQNQLMTRLNLGESHSHSSVANVNDLILSALPARSSLFHRLLFQLLAVGLLSR